MTARLAVLSLALLAAACDESQAIHRPDFQLDRMQEQPRVDPFDRAMSAPPELTVARGSAATRPRPAVDRGLVERGRGAFDRTCAACHGVLGDGDSVVAAKMMLRRPPSLLEARLRALSDDQIHDVVVKGYGLMGSYAGQLHGDEDWGVVSYVRALQISGGVAVAQLPPAMRDALAKEAP